METNVCMYICFPYLCPQIIVKKFQCCQLFIHPFGIICLLFLYNLSSCLDDSFNLQFHLTEGLVEFLKKHKYVYWWSICSADFQTDSSGDLTISLHLNSEQWIQSKVCQDFKLLMICILL